jgi:hypothetical protein
MNKYLNKLKQYLLNILILLDEALNTILFFGDPRETMSSRIGKYATKKQAWACFLCKILDAIDKRHCATAQEPTVGDRNVVD